MAGLRVRLAGRTAKVVVVGPAGSPSDDEFGGGNLASVSEGLHKDNFGG